MPRDPRFSCPSQDGYSSTAHPSAVHACEECRRRHKRCNGTLPCDTCLYYKKVKLCRYADLKPSRKVVEKLNGIAVQYRALLERVFPSRPLESLFDLTREQLLELIFADDPSQRPRTSSSLSEIAAPTRDGATALPSSSLSNGLEALQLIPDGNTCEARDPVDALTDDVNALSLSPGQTHTYLGVSSINAVFRVIMFIDPDFRPSPDRTQHGAHKVSENGSEELAACCGMFHLEEKHVHPHTAGLLLINAFFNYVHHPFTPLLDEAQFRYTYLHGGRHDPRWMALLNTVLALGSISVCNADPACHSAYFRKAMTFLTLETAGDVHLETVQMLALLAGHYLHFVSQPNLAYSLTGVAIRMATTLSLHKDALGDYQGEATAATALRRCIWWSLFCMDTWCGMTLGRPTFGRLGTAITVRLPEHADGQNSLDSVALIENIHMCKISTRIQDALADAPSIPYREMEYLDTQLVNWYERIPAMLKPDESFNDSIFLAGTTLRWRFQNQRMLLYRPALLSYAMSRIPYTSLCLDDRLTLKRCRAVACESIYDMAGVSVNNPPLGRAVVWFIFQAALIPLLGLFIADETMTSEDDSAATPESCRMQVEVTMSTLARMETWCRTARRTLDVVSEIFNAARRGRNATAFEPQPAPSSRTQSSGIAPTTSPLNLRPLLLSQPPLAFGGDINPTDSQDSVVAVNGDGTMPAEHSLFAMTDQGIWNYINWAVVDVE